MKFEELFNRMHCDFFEIEYMGERETIEYELSGEMTKKCKKYYECEVVDFYVTRSTKSNKIGLIIRLK